MVLLFSTKLETNETDKSRKENPQLSPRSHPRHLVRKRTAEKYVIKDITSDSQVSLTINIYFYLFLYL